MNEVLDFNPDIQKLLISYMLADANSYTQCQNIIQDRYFVQELRPSIRFIQSYTEKYRKLPELVQVQAATGTAFDDIQTCSQHSKWFLDTVEGFSRQRALVIAVQEGADLVEQGQGGELERRIKEALSISLMKDLGTDYFNNPPERIKRMKDNSALYSTGWKSVDRKLFGGFAKGTLNIFAAGSGVGKSLVLANLACNWALEGKRVVYISLELSEDLVANRFDAILGGVSTTEVIANSHDVGLKIAMIGRKAKGTIHIKRLPESTTTANDIRAYLKEYEVRFGVKPDAVLIDYLDIMAPSAKVDLGNLSVKDKYVSEEVRALLSEWDVLSATASQLNRSSIEATDYDHSHIAGGLTKIQTSDTSFGILAPPSWKEKGKMEFQLLKTRSSSGVGSKIEMAYDPVTMRISDKPESEASQEGMSPLQLKNEIAAVIDNKPSVATKRDDLLAFMSRSQSASSL